jgi:hypothetical protein
MTKLDERRRALETSLTSRGWVWENGTLYAQHRTIWFSELDRWIKEIPDLYETMIRRRARIIGLKQYYSNPQQHENVVHDLDQLIEAISEWL